MTDHRSPAISAGEFLLLVAICFGWSILASISAVFNGFPANGFNDTESTELVWIELFTGCVALMFLFARRYPLASLVPQVTWRATVQGSVLLVGAWLLSTLSMALFSERSLAPINEIMAASQVSLPIVLLLSVVNGVFEELFLLAVMQRGLMHHGAMFAVGAAMLVRVSYHLYQGPAGAVGVLVWGLCAALYYLRAGDLWGACWAHILTDVVALG